MKKGKKIIAILTAAALGVSLAGCGAASDTAADTSAQSVEAAGESTGSDEKVSKTLPSVTAADADTRITFSDGSADIEGDGAEAEGAVVTIKEAGKYAVLGSTSKGQLVVDAGEDDEVTLILAGTDITCEDDAAIYIKSAKLAEVILADESENRLISGEEREIDLSAKNVDSEDASGGALQAKCDLTLTGNGKLDVFGYINNGIQSSDDLTVNGGTIEVTAVNHALRGNDMVTVNGGDITLTALQDGIHSNGDLSITGGNITLATADDGIHADNDLTIEDGSVDITESYEGIEALNILISGGVINVVSSDDGINASDGSGGGFGFGGGVEPPEGFELPEGFEMPEDMESLRDQILSGELELPEGFELPGGMNREGGMQGGFGGRGGMEREDTDRENMDRGNREMPEGMEERGGMGREGMGQGNMDRENREMPEGMEERGGMNREGGMQGGFGGRGGMENVDPDSLPNLRITGGTITVTAQGDGLDSNGNIYIDGGYVIVNGPTMSSNGALDYGSENGGVCLISGGTVLALGASGMAETFGSDSSQCSFICNLESSFDEGDVLTITAEDGTVLMEQEIIKKGSSVVFSSPDLNTGDTVTLSVGDESQEITLDGVSTSVGGRGFGIGGFGGMGGFNMDDREGFPNREGFGGPER